MPNPNYSRTLRNIALSNSKPEEVKVAEFLDKFKSLNLNYSGYIKHILKNLTEKEKQIILKGNFDTVPSKFIPNMLKVSNIKIQEIYSTTELVNHFDQYDIVKDISDEVLLAEISRRGLNSSIQKNVFNQPEETSNIDTTCNYRIEENEDGNVLVVIDEDGTQKIYEGEQAQILYEKLQKSKSKFF